MYIIKNITSFIRNHLLIYLNQKLDVTLLIESFCKVILLPFNYYKNKKASEVLSRINDLSYIKSFISKIIVTILLDILLFIISFIIIFNINKDILILYLVGAFLYFLIIIIYNTIIKNTIITKQERVVEVNNTIIESVNGFETIKGLNIEDNIIYKFSKNYSKLLNINYYTDKINNTILLLKEFITDSIILLVSYYTFSLIMNSKVTVGDYMTISFLSSYLIYPFRNIIDLIYEYYYVKNSIRRANDFFDIEDEKIYEDKRLEVNGNIKIVNLSYTFNNKYYVLKNINLFIKDKDRVLLLGSSGSGKSTILKLLYIYSLNKRIFDKTAIEILYNIFINNNYDIEKYFKKIIITNEDDIVALYSQEKNSIIININKIIKEFTEMINKLYGTRLKLSPLNISESILINKITYVKRIDNIYFDTKHDSNIEINAWFNFILDMIDEQLYKAMNKLEKIDSSFVIEDVPTGNMRLSRLKHR